MPAIGRSNRPPPRGTAPSVFVPPKMSAVVMPAFAATPAFAVTMPAPTPVAAFAVPADAAMLPATPVLMFRFGRTGNHQRQRGCKDDEEYQAAAFRRHSFCDPCSRSHGNSVQYSGMRNSHSPFNGLLNQNLLSLVCQQRFLLPDVATGRLNPKSVKIYLIYFKTVMQRAKFRCDSLHPLAFDFS